MKAASHYQALFRELESRHGRLDEETLTSVVGFSAGGPVSLSQLAKRNIYVTCELSLYPGQKPTSEGMKFELLSLGAFDKAACRTLFTALGRLSMEQTLGDGHTIDVSGVMSAGEPPLVTLKLFSQAKVGNETFGVYQVTPVPQ
jgi:hypothetical protein